MLDSFNASHSPMAENAVSSNFPYSVNVNGDFPNDCLPPDPLLQSGTYIHADSNATVETTPERSLLDEPHVSDPMPAAPAMESTAEIQTVSPELVTPKRRQNKSVEVTSERPSWLPENWKIEMRVRTSGATAGSTDRYFFEPVSGRKFRSKVEVLYFLETGGKRKKGNTGNEATPSETSKSQKQKKGGSKTQKITSFYFDSGNPPHSVCWVQTDGFADTWAPSCNGGMIPERRRQEWDAVFSSVSQLRRRNV
ncbi:methyl-CpG-binding domain-containing protein 5 [Nicotiana tabacum]|uniref:Methyl-CpG-binding domain-containing protein 5 n=1 Tax=Nicotiana tabacum TaxID=4097 RepID=A0A1S4B4I2_TOBAC|nr:PREDICTED: methyl-CpG-binding domain-containing protein 5-like [Nicotiana tabacum]